MGMRGMNLETKTGSRVSYFPKERKGGERLSGAFLGESESEMEGGEDGEGEEGDGEEESWGGVIGDGEWDGRVDGDEEA